MWHSVNVQEGFSDDSPFFLLMDVTIQREILNASKPYGFDCG